MAVSVISIESANGSQMTVFSAGCTTTASCRAQQQAGCALCSRDTSLCQSPALHLWSLEVREVEQQHAMSSDPVCQYDGWQPLQRVYWLWHTTYVKPPQAWAGFQPPPEACEEFVPSDKDAANAG